MIDFFHTSNKIFLFSKHCSFQHSCHRRSERFGSRELIEVSTFVIGILLKPIIFEILFYQFLTYFIGVVESF
jgi:hypothetical protein